jgi:hypothetical protein
MFWEVGVCSTLYNLLEQIKAGSVKHIVFVAPESLRGLSHSHYRQVACPPRAGLWAMAYFTYALIRTCIHRYLVSQIRLFAVPVTRFKTVSSVFFCRTSIASSALWQVFYVSQLRDFYFWHPCQMF